MLIAGGLWTVGCSSDDADPDPQDQGTGGTGGEAPDAGDDAEPDADDKDAEPDADDKDAEPDAEDEEPASAECGTVTCEGVLRQLGQVTLTVDGCCADEATEACGLIVPEPIGNGSCVALNQPGDLDTACEEYDLPGKSQLSFLPKLPGCCTPTGTCGYSTEGTSLETLGISLGCVNPEDVGVELPDGPVSCGDPGDDDPPPGDDDDPPPGDDDEEDPTP